MVKSSRNKIPRWVQIGEIMGKVRCIICDSLGEWENVDQFRFKPKNMCMCKKCGFITYPDGYKDSDKIKDHYRNEYRQAPTVQNVFSSERKLHYHINFLEDLFNKWKKEAVNPTVLEVGSAMGLFLNWIKTQFPKSDINGTELTKSFVRAAFWVYSLRLDEEADFNKKYDLIISYKVAEHIPNVDVELEKYANSLTENGFLYISVPTWFHKLYNFGMSGFSLEYYYDPNHINVWSRKQFETLLDKAGLEIVKENHTYYDDTYLCKKNEDHKKKDRYLESPGKRKEELAKVYEAGKAYEEQNFAKAIELWPNFPSAHIANYEMNRGKVHKEGWDVIVEKHIKPLMTVAPNDFHALSFVADLQMRYDHFDDAIKTFEKALISRPMEGNALLGISHCLRNKALKAKNLADKINLYREAMGVCGLIEKNSMQSRYEAITWILQDAAEIPTPFEAEGKDLYKEVKQPNENNQ